MKMIWFTGLALIGALAATTHAQTYKVLVNLNNVNDSFIDAFYFGSIAQSRGGYMICTVPSNSVSDGVAMRISTSGVQTILHEFDNVGGYPTAGVMLGRNGEFFGTTLWSSTNLGSIFEMAPDGTVKVLHELISGPDRYPNAPLIQSLCGDFYGTMAGTPRIRGAFTRSMSMAVSPIFTPLQALTEPIHMGRWCRRPTFGSTERRGRAEQTIQGRSSESAPAVSLKSCTTLTELMARFP